MELPDNIREWVIENECYIEGSIDDRLTHAKRANDVCMDMLSSSMAAFINFDKDYDKIIEHHADDISHMRIPERFPKNKGRLYEMVLYVPDVE